MARESTMTKQNILKELNREIERNEELLIAYKKIGAPGAFASMTVTQLLERARSARDSGERQYMLDVLDELKSTS